jgi:hypothetical protein
MLRSPALPLDQALEDGFVAVEELASSRVRVRNRAATPVRVQAGEPLGECPDRVARTSVQVPAGCARTLEVEAAPGAALRRRVQAAAQRFYRAAGGRQPPDVFDDARLLLRRAAELPDVASWPDRRRRR